MRKTKKSKKIFIAPIAVAKIAAQFHCAKQTVYLALKYKLTSDKGEAIRTIARKEYGGVDIPYYETIAD